MQFKLCNSHFNNAKNKKHHFPPNLTTIQALERGHSIDHKDRYFHNQG